MANTIKEKKVREPLFHIAKRDKVAFWFAWSVRIVAVIVALLVSALVTVLLTGENPLSVYKTMIDGAIGTERRIWGLMQNIAMLLCVSLAVTPAFKMKFWNIGAEGQVLVGALATAACMKFCTSLADPSLFAVMVFVSMAVGALWAFLPAIFKAKWNTNETLFTLMMNYIAIQILSYFTYKWSVPKGSGKMGIINPGTNIGWLPTLDFPNIPFLDGQKYLLNVVIVLCLTAVMYVYLKYSKHGYEISVVGESEKTAKYIGINVNKVIVRTMLLSGAVCGIAGFLLVSGTDHTVSHETAGGRGFTAIMVSWLAKFNPIYMILTAFLIVFLQKGAGEISSMYGLNNSFSEIITGIIIFFIIGCEFFLNYTVKLCKPGKEAKAK